MSTAYPTTWRKPPQMIQSRGWRIALAVGAIVYLVLAIGSVEVNWTRVIAGMERAQRFVAGFLQPDFTTRWRDISNGLMESLTMTFTSTVVGVLISIPIGVGPRAMWPRPGSTISAAASSRPVVRFRKSSLRSSSWPCSVLALSRGSSR